MDGFLDNKTVLVIEGVEGIILLRDNLLAREGYEVLTYRCLGEALETLREREVDAIVTDLSLPGVTGPEAVPLIKKASPRVPIITVTGDNSEELEGEIREKGIFYYFTKPFDGEDMKLVIRKAVERKEKEGESKRKMVLAGESMAV